MHDFDLHQVMGLRLCFISEPLHMFISFECWPDIPWLFSSFSPTCAPPAIYYLLLNSGLTSCDCILQVESIVLSIISMLSSPNDESPANVDAAKQWRDNREEFRKKVSRCVRKSQEML
uniref:UBC core domain-containing protein n=1 Tax=Rhizophora mucronata TaxID=61149 RepID=A0A2P2L244_RHIMU